MPLAGSVPFTVPFQIEGATSDDPDRRPTTDVRVASTRYFETLGIPLVRGRVFTDFDERDAPPVAIINRSMMRYWESRDPIGSRVSIDRGESWATIVGVVGDVRQSGLDREATAQVYAPLRQSGGGFAGRILVRARTHPIELSRAVRDTVHAIDPNMPVENAQTLLDLRDQSLATPRLTATLLALFAALALAVTLTGITGVIATSVTERTPEFGIRMALGATRTSVLGRVMAQGLVLIGIGLGVGVLVSLVGTRILATFLFATAPTDPMTFVAVSATFIAAGVMACFGPAWRATTVDPVRALRAE